MNENVMIKKESEDKTNSPETGMLRCLNNLPEGMAGKNGKPKSAGNAGFRKHNKIKFMKTEKWKKTNGKFH